MINKTFEEPLKIVTDESLKYLCEQIIHRINLTKSKNFIPLKALKEIKFNDEIIPPRKRRMLQRLVKLGIVMIDTNKAVEREKIICLTKDYKQNTFNYHFFIKKAQLKQANSKEKRKAIEEDFKTKLQELGLTSADMVLCNIFHTEKKVR